MAGDELRHAAKQETLNAAAPVRLALPVEPRKIHPPRDVILNPVCVPPFLGIDLNAVELHREVDVVASRHAGLAADTHHLALLHEVAFLDINPAEMAIDRL